MDFSTLFCLDWAASCLGCATGVRDASNFVVSVNDFSSFEFDLWSSKNMTSLAFNGEVCSKLWTLQCIQCALTFCLLDPFLSLLLRHANENTASKTHR